jgi:hypothetical protein
MTRAVRIVALMSLLGALAPEAWAQKVSYDFDKTADFSKFRTFAVRTGSDAEDSPFMDERITKAVEAELAAKGMVRSDAHPDVLVITHLKLDRRDEVVAYGSGYPYYPYGWWGAGYSSGWWGWGGWGVVDYRVYPITVGTITIDVSDPAHGTVWRGTGVKDVDPQSKPWRRDKNVRHAVTKIMKNYPPPRHLS